LKYRTVFDKYPQEYDNWYQENYNAYISEVDAIRKVLPKGRGLEIGVGSGRFAVPLKINYGIDISFALLKIAQARGINVICADALKLPFKDSSFDYALIAFTICFLKKPLKALIETNRVLKKDGHVIIAFIDRESFLGKYYLRRRDKSIFYKEAIFYNIAEIAKLLKDSGFSKFLFYQTLFDLPKNLAQPDPVLEGYGEGGFTVIRAKKII
jgi:ubiquinone/menaquinone biosynthesis C-methylase UbiE